MPAAVRALLGESPSMRNLRRMICRIAPSRMPVLIEGETGTGKELVAHAIHQASGRQGAIVPFNVCAIPEAMFESTLFGHKRGAYTGATQDSEGFLAEADHGTAFFDEISTLAPAAQGKLLRALETGAYRPVGARADRRSDFRIVAATNEPLAERVRAGAFRADLAQRLSGCVLALPPLRERAGDIMLLVTHFVRLAGDRRLRFDQDAEQALVAHNWPGNVRELRMLVDRLHILADTELITAADIRDVLGAMHIADPATPPDGSAERERILAALRAAGGDTALAARSLGVHRSTLYRRMRRLGLSAAEHRRAGG